MQLKLVPAAVAPMLNLTWGERQELVRQHARPVAAPVRQQLAHHRKLERRMEASARAPLAQVVQTPKAEQKMEAFQQRALAEMQWSSQAVRQLERADRAQSRAERPARVGPAVGRHRRPSAKN